MKTKNEVVYILEELDTFTGMFDISWDIVECVDSFEYAKTWVKGNKNRRYTSITLRHIVDEK